MPRSSVSLARLALGGLLFGSVAACTAILGIEQRPLRQEGRSDAGKDASDGNAPDPPDANGCDPKKGCLCATGDHTFCANFDRATKINDEWTFDPLDGMYQQGDSKSELTTEYDPRSTPNALLTTVHGKAPQASISAVLQALKPMELKPGAPFVGARFRFKTRLELTKFSPAGPIPEIGTGGIAGLFQGALLTDKYKGVMLVVAEKGVYVTATDDAIGTKAAGEYRQVTNTRTEQQGWLGVELVLADRDRLIAEGLTTCSTEAPGLAVAVVMPGGGACLTLPTELATLDDWAKGLTVLIGGITVGDGNLVVIHDDVTVDLLGPPASGP